LAEAVRLSRKIGRTAPFADLIDHEMAPGPTVDDGEALRENIVSTVGATAVVNAWGKVRGVEALRVVDASILPDIPFVAMNVTTIMLAERIAAKLTASASDLQFRRSESAA
jgi:choline dehydrogenase